jgi:hypothetical protein
MKNKKVLLFVLILIIGTFLFIYRLPKVGDTTKVYIINRPPPTPPVPPVIPRIDLEQTESNRRLTQYPIHTRGFTRFSNIGYLYDENNLVLPLYGKQTNCGSTTWNYYILDQEHRIKIPLQVEDRDCMEQIGCKELYNDDTVHIRAYNKNFKVYMYKPNLYL